MNSNDNAIENRAIENPQMINTFKYYQKERITDMIKKQTEKDQKDLEDISKTFNIKNNDIVYKAFEKLLKTMFPDCYVIYALRDLMLKRGIIFELPAKDKIIEKHEKSLRLAVDFDKDDGNFIFTVFVNCEQYSEIKPIKCDTANLKESILKINDEYQSRLISSEKKYQEQFKNYCKINHHPY